MLKDPLESTHRETEVSIMLPDPTIVAQHVCTPRFSASFIQRWFLGSVVILQPLTILDTGDRLKVVLKYLLQRENEGCFFFMAEKINTRLRMRKGDVGIH